MSRGETICQCGYSAQPVTTDPHRYIPATAACWACFNEVLARDYADRLLFDAAHRITVDAYAAQHPRDHPSKSLTAHLVGLYAVFELGLSHAMAGARLKDFVEQSGEFPTLEAPTSNWSLTIADVAAAKTRNEQISAARTWAHQVWTSWSAQHAAIAALAGRCA